MCAPSYQRKSMQNYGLKPSYMARSKPEYFSDSLPDSTAWQADVYRLAAGLALKANVKRLVDIGCGQGGKLASYAGEFEIVGYDYGDNIAKCQQAYPEGQWHTADLESESITTGFQDSVVICADVIEHLIKPDMLLETLRNAAKTAAYVLVSTPDRMRVYRRDQSGPPGNPYHVREWTLNELESWFHDEQMPIRWSGWTVSNDSRPHQIWTSLLVMSKDYAIDRLPVAFEQHRDWNAVQTTLHKPDRIKVWMTPTVAEAERDVTNSIHQIVVRLGKHLPKYGIDLVENPREAHLRAGHAGQGSDAPIDVAHYHGLYPTADGMGSNGYFAINAKVIQNLKTAKAITAPSNWIADVLRRDMHVNPHIISWGVDTDEWTPDPDPQSYVLWNKARVDAVCDPTPMIKLAARAHDTLFLTTFGEGTPNIKTVGRQPYETMKQMVRKAGVYLSTNVETFGIGTLEAMAAGVPVLAFRLPNTDQLIEHGVTGFLAEPGDIDGLYEGLLYCQKHHKTLGANAREAVKAYSWDCLAERFAAVYRSILEPHQGVKVSVVLPCHNYARFLPTALESVLSQKADFEIEVIVVCDRCTDDSEAVARSYADRGVYTLVVDNGNLSATRNNGIEHASGEYIVCLDSDDELGSPDFLQTLANALDADRTLGIAFTGIQFMDAEGKLGHLSTWPKGYDFNKQAAHINQVPSCCMFRKEAWRRAGGFRPYFVYAQDAEFWTTVGAIGYGATQVTEAGWFHYRLHNQSQSQVHRNGTIPEPDWLEWHPWTKDNQRPFAADGNPPLGSWPVRFYQKPEVSVIIPVGKGHEIAVKDALHSLEGQTFRFWECIVVNDSGSTLDLENGYPWAKVINTNGCIGAGAARNLGAKQSHAPFIVFLDADDMLKPRFLEATLQAYRQNGRYAYTDWLTEEQQTNFVVHPTPEYTFQAVWERPSIHPVTTLIPRLWFEAVGGFDETMAAFEDVDFYMKMLVHGYCGVRVPEPLMIYHLQSGFRRQAGEAIKDQFKVLLTKRYGAYMEGRTMCNCVEPPKGKGRVPPTPENVAEYREAYGEMVKVQLTSEDAPLGAATFLGPATRVNYGRRSRNDVFYVWEKDVTNSEGVFTALNNYETEAAPTVVPPAPEPVDANLQVEHVDVGSGEPMIAVNSQIVTGTEPTEPVTLTQETEAAPVESEPVMEAATEAEALGDPVAEDAPAADAAPEEMSDESASAKKNAKSDKSSKTRK